MTTGNSSAAFCRWRKRMGYTYHEAANALGLCVAAIGNYTTGVRKDRKDDDATPVEVPRSVLLACSALEKSLPPID